MADQQILDRGRIINDVWLVALMSILVKLALYLHIQTHVLRGLAGILKPLICATALMDFGL
ncbi:hypothetical protein SLEP1_g53953 [Rubroshorea leprosula]|uniref:Uncharacterized protein n=1 Tax=Rubroshorea leprosula TaxID=152421 RepID=A0AAV5MDS0_9ROSI|nr:hypothetical protein SLEP1_g53953 [Rubroshorea leprosula]